MQRQLEAEEEQQQKSNIAEAGAQVL